MSFPNEKTASYLPVSNQGPVHKVSKSKKVIGSLLAVASIAWAGNLYVSRLTGAGFVDRWTSPAPLLENQCPQVDALTPKFTTPALELIIPTIESPTYKKSSVAILSNAVKIPTVSRDDMGHPGEDERWEIFYEFYDYLKKTFPLIHKHLDIDKVNTHGLVYTWKGTNPSLKPTLLLAHQDVVPVPETTIPTWTHPPFGGVFDGTFVWGRGSSDCKNQLLGIMESVELLLTAKFIPTRTILLSFGFDEECGGTEGAGSLATYLVGKYGKDSMAVIVDEGMKMQKLWGALVAQPGVAEKGAMDVHVTVRTPGGHSSVPPPHTSIGVLSELIQLIEAATYPTYLDEKNPYYGTIQCGAEYAPEFPDNLRKILSHKKRTSGAKSCMKKDLLAEEAAKESLFHKYLMTTSVAVDVISGGIKSNALPEEVTVTVNHRVNIGDSTHLVKSKLATIAAQVAQKHNLTVHAYDGIIAPSSIMLSAPDTLEPAPVTPTSLDALNPWGILSGTTRAQYGEDVIMAPGLMTGNTDTRFYWDLSRDIFRYGPGYHEDGGDVMGGIHTVNEKVSVNDHLETVKWFVMFIRNMDEAALP